MRFHKLQNVQIALDYLRHRQVHKAVLPAPGSGSLALATSRNVGLLNGAICSQVKLVNIRNDDIADGNPKLTLGLIWTIILHFQVGGSPAPVCLRLGIWWPPQRDGWPCFWLGCGLGGDVL